MTSGAMICFVIHRSLFPYYNLICGFFSNKKVFTRKQNDCTN